MRSFTRHRTQTDRAVLLPSRESVKLLPITTHTLGQPIEIALLSSAQGQHNKLRRVIRMVGQNQTLQSRQPGACRFQKQQHFRACFQFISPPKVRFDFRNQIGARNQPRFQRGFGQLARRLQVRRGDWCIAGIRTNRDLGKSFYASQKEISARRIRMTQWMLR